MLPSAANYEQSVIPVANVSTVDAFLNVYLRIRRPNLNPKATPHSSSKHRETKKTNDGFKEDEAYLPAVFDLSVFREGIKPLWEDVHNARGGKVIIRFKKGLVARLWEHLLIALLDSSSPLYLNANGKKRFEETEVCGAVLGTRLHDDAISLWIKSSRDGEDDAVVEGCKAGMLAAMGLSSSTPIEFKPHSLSLQNKKKQPTATATTSGSSRSLRQ